VNEGQTLYKSISDGFGSKIFDPGRVNFLWLGSGRVSHLWFGLEFGKFPLKMSNFSPSGQKKLLWVGSESTRVKAGSAFYLLRVKSKLGSGQGPSLKSIYIFVIFCLLV